MSPAAKDEHARVVLRLALERRVVEEDDLGEQGLAAREPGATLEALRRSALLPAAAWDALERIAERAAIPDASIDETILDAPTSALLAELAWQRTAVALGVSGAFGPSGTVAGTVSKSRTVDATSDERVRERARAPRRACGRCLHVAPDELAGHEPCPYCWAAEGDSSRTAAPDNVTTDAPGRAVRENLPALDGEFAGHLLLERIGEGGMGVVFKARQIALNRIVALKLLRAGALADGARRRRFLLEAEAAAGLKHQGIVPVHEIGEVAGYPYYTMDFVAGCTLAEHAARAKLSPRAIAGLLRQVVDAVHHFHVHGIVHRDLKPENILVPEDRVPRIIDFGIAKKLNAEDGRATTYEGDVLGTLQYMPPEQAAGRVAEVDTRTDIYALGAILYELLSGKPPFAEIEGPRLLVVIQVDDPPRLRSRVPEIDADLDAIVAKAMARERERRYQSAAELADDLRCYELQLPVRARPATFRYRARKALRRHRTLAVGIATALAATAVVAGALGEAAVARRHAIEALLLRSEDSSLDPSEREKTLERAIFMDPANETARARLDVLVTEHQGAEALAREKERQKEAALEDQLARARAEAEAREVRERERVRIESEQSSRAAAEARARALLERALGETSELTAIRLLSDALALVPDGQGELRSRLEDLRVELEVRQTRAALETNQTGLAEFWLEDARSLARAHLRDADLVALEARLRALVQGLGELAEARELLKSGALVEARARFEAARARGVARDVLAKDQATLDAVSLERGRSLLDEGRAGLERGEAKAALARASQALRFVPDLADAAALASDCETRIATDARREASSLSARPETRRQALAVLEQAARALRSPLLVRSLERERGARQHLLDDPAFAGLVFVPEVPELATEPFYMERTPVTNAAFREFVAARGYETRDLWDAAALPLLPTFRDGPRTWTDGGFGDAANASRPVSGVTAFEARAFARWLSRKTGARVRLPAEREWEIAAGWDPLTGRSREYPWGDAFVAWPAGSAPRVVGTLAADRSALGILDPGDGVREWVERRDGRFGTKGAGFAGDEPTARHYARVGVTGAPDAAPSLELVRRIGFRLVREIEGSQ